MYSRFSLLAVLVLATPALATPALAQDDIGRFTTQAPHAAIIDFNTGEVLFEKAARTPIAPASMTKIMTANMVFEMLEDGQLSSDQMFTVSENAWRKGGAKSGSSTMFLDLGSDVSVSDLLRGVIVQSGNDACIVLAEGIAGTEAAFANRMNDRAAELGLDSMNFVNATGWPDDGHVISTLDLAKLAAHQIETFPDYYEIYAEDDFEWNGIKQNNRNPLLGRVAGADGLKTGHTEISGYGLVGSAERDGQRRIIVVNGLDSKSDRATESRRLMNAAFDQFDVYDLVSAGDTIADIPVYMGEAETVSVRIAEDVSLGLPKIDRSGLNTRVEYRMPAAPVAAGQVVGELIVTAPGRPEARYPLMAAEDVATKSLMGRLASALGSAIG